MSIYEEIQAERARQDAKWGEQNHPSFDTVLMDRVGGCTPQRMCEEYEIPSEMRAKYLCQSADRDVTWPHIAVEELCEAVSTLDEKNLRGELVQLAAVVVQWIECIDRRAASSAEGNKEDK